MDKVINKKKINMNIVSIIISNQKIPFWEII